MLARDLMTAEMFCVTVDTPVSQLMQSMLDKDIGTALVTDGDGSLIGLVSEGDLLRRQDAQHRQVRDDWLSLLAQGKALNLEFLDQLRLTDRTAATVMSSPVIVLDEGAELAQVAEVMLVRDIKRVPITRQGKLVGVVSRRDILRALLNQEPGRDAKAGVGIVFYSRSGTGQAVAEQLAALSGWPMHEVVDARPRTGLAGDLRCVTDTLLKRDPPFHYRGPNLDSFGHIVLIAPVWLRSLAAPMRAFLHAQGTLVSEYSVICVMSGYGGLRAIDDIAAIARSKPEHVLLLKQHEVLARRTDADIGRFLDRVLETTNRRKCSN